MFNFLNDWEFFISLRRLLEIAYIGCFRAEGFASRSFMLFNYPLVMVNQKFDILCCNVLVFTLSVSKSV